MSTKSAEELWSLLLPYSMGKEELIKRLRRICIKCEISMDRNELLKLYETHVLPKPQRNMFKCIKNAKLPILYSDVPPSSTTNFKRILPPEEKTTGFFEKNKIHSVTMKKNRIDIGSTDLKRRVRENNESVEEYVKKRSENYPKLEKLEDEQKLTNVETIKGEPSSPPKKKFKRIEFP